MNTQTQNTRNIDYNNYHVIDLGRNIPLNCGNYGRYEIIRPDGRRHGIYKDPDIARCDFRWYMERMMDSAFGCLRWA